MPLFLKQKKESFLQILLLALSLFCIPYQTMATPSPKVLVTIKPIHSLAAAVMEGVATPELILPDGASPHTFLLKPSTFKQLQQADVVIWVGPTLESFMVKALEQKRPSLSVLSLQTLSQLNFLPQRQGRQWEHSHNDDHHHTHDQPHAHSSEAIDPHFWLSTDNAVVIVNYLADYLSERDPSHASQYHHNAKNMTQQLNTLKHTLQILLKPVHAKPFLVYHDGYQYFEKEFDLNGVGTMVLNPHLPLSAHGLKSIQDLITAKQVHCVFRETEFNDNTIYHSLGKLKVKVAELDPLGARIPAGPQNYENTMMDIGKTMAACLKDEKKYN